MWLVIGRKVKLGIREADVIKLSEVEEGECRVYIENDYFDVDQTIEEVSKILNQEGLDD